MRRRWRTAWTALLLTVATGGVRVGTVPTIRYVSTTGDDANSCAASANQGTPKQHLNGGSGALACMASGDTLFMRGGSYNEGIYTGIASGVSWSNFVRIAAYPNETPTLTPLVHLTNNDGRVISLASLAYVEIDGVNVDATHVGFNAVFIQGNSDHIRIQNLDVHEGVKGGAAAVIVSGNDNELLGMTVHGGGTAGGCGTNCSMYGFYVAGDRNVIDGANVYDTSTAGVQIYSSDRNPTGNIVRNSRIHDITRSGDNRLHCVYISGYDSEIYNNVFYNMNFAGDDGRACLYAYSAVNAKMYNNTVSSFTGWGMSAYGSTGTDFKNNIIQGATLGTLTQSSSSGTLCSYILTSGPTNGCTNSFASTSAGFISAGTQNYQLSVTSAAIDHGATTTYTTDFLGVIRPKGLAFDIGAYEYAPGGGGITPTGTFYTAATGGNDARTCAVAQDPLTPLLTIVAGMNCLQTVGDILLIKAGSYNERLTSDVLPALAGTSWTNKFRIANNPGDTVTLAPSSGNFGIDLFEAEAYVEFDGININGAGLVSDALLLESWGGGNAHHIRFKNATITGTPTHGISAYMTSAGQGSNEFQYLTIHDTGTTDGNHGIVLLSPNNVVENCIFYNLKGAAVDLDNDNGLTFAGTVIRNNVIRDGLSGPTYQNFGVEVNDNAVGAAIYNNLIYHLLGSRGTPAGIFVSANASGTQLYNNTIYGGAGRGIFISGGSGSVVRNNIGWQNGLGDYADSGTSTTQDHNLFASNPLFVNPSTSDFRLAAGSPAIDAGVTTTLFTTDIVGNSRLAAATPMTPLATLACTAATYPGCGGWGPALDVQGGTQWSSRTFLPAGGPNGEDVVEFIQQPHPQGQYYMGWFSPPGLQVPAQGAVRYLRTRIFTPNPSLATADFWGDKFIILGDGNDNTSRVICNLRDNGLTTDTLAIACSRNIDGEEHGTPIIPLPLGQWVNIQVEVRSSATTASNDGQLKLWVNSNTYAAPTATSPTYQQNVVNWGNINVGFYADSRATTITSLLYRIAAFELDDEFDPSWAGGVSLGAYDIGAYEGSASAPSTPQILHLRFTR